MNVFVLGVVFALLPQSNGNVPSQTFSDRELFATYVSHQDEIEAFAELLENPGTDGQIINLWMDEQSSFYSIGIRDRIQTIIDRLRDRSSNDLNERERRFDPDRTTIRDRIRERRENFWRFVRQTVLTLLVLTWAAIMYKLW